MHGTTCLYHCHTKGCMHLQAPCVIEKLSENAFPKGNKGARHDRNFVCGGLSRRAPLLKGRRKIRLNTAITLHLGRNIAGLSHSH